MGIILKNYKNLTDKMEYNKNYNEAEKLLYEYEELLKLQGWSEIITEGGVMSPDGSTLFIVSRSPYNGQLLPLSQSMVNSYNTIVDELIESGDFVKY